MSQDIVDASPFSKESYTSSTNSQPIYGLQNGSSTSEVLTLPCSLVASDCYNIKNGIAVVINNIEFHPNLDLPDRKGSDIDASSLFQRFQELDFDSDIMNDASTADIEEKFNEIKQDKETLKKTGCLIVAFLTHGNEEGIYATDREMKIKNLMDTFNATNCPELALKPKIFIFQACRGRQLGGGVNAKVIRDRDPNQADAVSDPSEYDKIHGETIRIPNEADFLAIYSTSHGYGSFRNTEKGSPFVRYLSDELLEMKTDEDFYKVLTRVNKRVGTGYKPNISNPGVVTQMPCFISHLTKDLFLKQLKI